MLVAVGVIAFLASGRGLLVPLAVTAALTAGSVMTLAGQSVPAFYAVGIAAVILIVTGGRDLDRVPSSPLKWLGGFAIWAALITLIAPTIFAGSPTLLSDQLQGAIGSPVPLKYTVSHIAQLIYLATGFATAVYLMRNRRTSNRLVDIMFLTGIGLSEFRWLSRYGLPWPDRFFDNSHNTIYIETFETGLPRFRGIFPEPSMLATFSVAGAFYFVVAGISRRGRARWWRIAAAAVGFHLLVVCTSTTALVAPIATMALLAGIWLFRFIRGDARLPVGAAIGGSFALAACVPFAGRAINAVTSQLDQKVATVSYTGRTFADHFAYSSIGRSYGLGFGLGSSRPSSFLPMLLSSVGIIGTALFAVAVGIVCWRAWRRPEARPVVIALATVIVAKCISLPDLNNPAALWVLIGVTAWHARQQAAADAQGESQRFTGTIGPSRSAA